MTSFSCFKYMSLYSAIQFTSVSFLYAKASNLGDFQFLYIDLLLILPLAILMGWAGPAPVLSRKRPTADLVSRKVLIPLLGLMVISILVQTTTYITVREQSWYKPPKVKHEHSNIRNSENTALFLISCFEYIFSGVVLNAGAPFRDRVVKNCKSHSWPDFDADANSCRAFHGDSCSNPVDQQLHVTQPCSLGATYYATDQDELGLQALLDRAGSFLSCHRMGV